MTMTADTDGLVERLRALQAYMRKAAHGTDAFDSDVELIDEAIAALSRELEEARAQRVEANNQWRIDYNELALERDEAKWLLKQMVEPDLTEGGVWKPITVNTIRYDEAKRFLKEPALSRHGDAQNTGGEG